MVSVSSQPDVAIGPHRQKCNSFHAYQISRARFESSNLRGQIRVTTERDDRLNQRRFSSEFLQSAVKVHERRNVRAGASQEQQRMACAVTKSVQFVRLHTRPLHRDRIGQASSSSKAAVGVAEDDGRSTIVRDQFGLGCHFVM